MSAIYPPIYLGATSLLPGKAGLLPPAPAGSQAALLTGAGTWTDLTYSGGILTRAGSIILNTGATALTIDGSQNATFAGGIVGTGATGGAKGAGTGNFANLYVNGVAVGTSTGNVSTTGAPAAAYIPYFTNGTTITGSANATLTSGGAMGLAGTAFVAGDLDFGTAQTSNVYFYHSGNSRTGINSTAGSLRLFNLAGNNNILFSSLANDGVTYTTWAQINTQTGATIINSSAAATSTSTGAFIVNNQFSVSGSNGNVYSNGSATFSGNVYQTQGQGWGITSTATAAGTTTLTSSSKTVQVFTGSTTQTVTLPAANAFGGTWLTWA